MGETDNFPEPRDPGPDRRDNVASAGLDPDTWEELEAWRTERRLKRSEATRRLIRTGLDAEETSNHISAPTLIAGLGLIAFLGAHAEVSFAPVLGNAGGVVVLLVLLYQYRQVTDYIRNLVSGLKP